MTETQKENILALRSKKVPFTEIAELTGISRNTIKSYCRRSNINNKPNAKGLVCLNCGCGMEQSTKSKSRKFCSDKCRYAYWNSHRADINHKVNHIVVCKQCGISFDSRGKERKFCCRTCYFNFRRGGSNG